MADRVWKGLYPLVIGRSHQFSQNKFFDLSTPFMRKGREGEKKRKENKAFVGLKSCDNVQNEILIFEYANYPKLQK